MLCYASCKPEQELTNYLCQYTHFSIRAIFKRRLELVFLYPFRPDVLKACSTFIPLVPILLKD